MISQVSAYEVAKKEIQILAKERYTSQHAYIQTQTNGADKKVVYVVSECSNKVTNYAGIDKSKKLGYSNIKNTFTLTAASSPSAWIQYFYFKCKLKSLSISPHLHCW